ncbi:chlorophyll a/b-binding protein [Nostoc sp.]|uniref:chlorophyll a/b-binding protein n=1 Tax=Nostoc sp. TaxID=1180 RepID=UPI003593EC4E
MRSGSIFDEQDKLNNLAAPQMYVTQQSQLGFTEYGEKLNGRLAMIGFVSLLVVEILTGHGAIAFLNSL